MFKGFFSVFLMGFLFSNVGFGQSPSMGESIKFINAKLGKTCNIDVVKGNIIAKYYNKGKDLVREDKVYVPDLDIEKSGYEEQEQVFYIPCTFKAGDCVFRKMHSTGNHREYFRISFIVQNDPKTLESLKKAFEHIYQMVKDEKYKETVKFE